MGRWIQFQATQKYGDKILKRWYVHTNHGRKVVWAETKMDAIDKMHRNSLRVLSIEPAAGMGE